MKLFYTPNPEILSLDETNHAKNVLRLSENACIDTMDGKGVFYNSKIVSYQKTGAILQILSQNVEHTYSKLKLHIAIAPTKNTDRTEWFVEKAVEIGVSEITFLQCQHSERKNINVERIEKVVVSAMKQSQKATMPKINNLTTFATFIKSLKSNQAKYMAHLEDQNRVLLYQKLQSATTLVTDCIIAIGPEGDFSPQEIALALQNNFEPVSLGQARLRTETAGVYAATLFSIFV